jgi:hypothetical protein
MCTNGCFSMHIYVLTNKTLIHNSLRVFGKWGKDLSDKKMYNYSTKMFTRRVQPIPIKSFQISAVLLYSDFPQFAYVHRSIAAVQEDTIKWTCTAQFKVVLLRIHVQK